MEKTTVCCWNSANIALVCGPFICTHVPCSNCLFFKCLSVVQNWLHCLSHTTVVLSSSCVSLILFISPNSDSNLKVCVCLSAAEFTDSCIRPVYRTSIFMLFRYIHAHLCKKLQWLCARRASSCSYESQLHGIFVSYFNTINKAVIFTLGQIKI